MKKIFLNILFIKLIIFFYAIRIQYISYNLICHNFCRSEKNGLLQLEGKRLSRRLEKKSVVAASYTYMERIFRDSIHQGSLLRIIEVL